MLTLKEMHDYGIKLQGNVNVKVFKDGEEVEHFTTTDFESEHSMMPRAFWENYPIDYMYYAAEALQIEILAD